MEFRSRSYPVLVVLDADSHALLDVVRVHFGSELHHVLRVALHVDDVACVLALLLEHLGDASDLKHGENFNLKQFQAIELT